MIEEIKEIFYKLRSDDYYEKHYQQSVYYEKDLKKLENYITNLQKENDNLKEKVHNQKLANAYATIQINKLQTRLKTYKRRKTAETQKKRIYKQRNEKAIEYIENHSRFEPPYYEMREFNNKANLNELYNILQGGDE